MRMQGAISCPVAATFSIHHAGVPEASEKGAKSCREDENVMSTIWKVSLMYSDFESQGLSISPLILYFFDPF